MKKKKIIKSVIFGSLLSSAAVIASPIAMSTNTHGKIQKGSIEENLRRLPVNPNLALQKAFLAKVNDHSTDKDDQELLENNWNLIKNSKFFTDDFAQNKNGKQYKITSIDDLVAKLKQLALPAEKEFTEPVKVAFGKWMIKQYAFTNFMVDKGFGLLPKVTQSEIVTNDEQTNYVNDIFNKDKNGNAINLLINNQKITLKGKTGFNSDWAKRSGNNNVYDISNQDIVNYLIATIANTKEFNTLINHLESNQKLRYTNKADQSFKQLINTYFDDANKVVELIPKPARNLILQLPHLDILTEIDLTKAISDTDTYIGLMQNGLGFQLYEHSYVQKINEFNSNLMASDTDELEYKMDNLVRELGSKLKNLRNLNHDNFLLMGTNSTDGNPASDANAMKAAFEFAMQLFSNSNNLKNDVEIKIDTRGIERGVISLRGGHTNEKWTQLETNSTSVTYVIPDTNADESGVEFIGYKNEGPGLEKTVLEEIFEESGIEKEIASANSPLIAIPNKSDAVWDTSGGGMIMGFIEMIIKTSQGVYVGDKSTDMKINDRDDDGRLKNNVVISSYVDDSTYRPTLKETYATIPWEVIVKTKNNLSMSSRNDLKNILLRFTFSGRSNASDEKPFDSLANKIRNEIENIANELSNKIKMWEKSATLNPVFDPTAPTILNIYITKISIGEIRYNTSNDTYGRDTKAYNFRFGNIKVTFDVNIVQSQIID